MSEAQYCQACDGDPRRRLNVERHKAHERESAEPTVPGKPSSPPLPVNLGDDSWLET